MSSLEFETLNTQLELLKFSENLNKIKLANEFKIRVASAIARPLLHVASLNSEFTSPSGEKFVSYFLLKGDMTNLQDWGVTEESIPKHIASFKGMPFTVTADRFFPQSPYGDETDHPVVDHFAKLNISRPRAVNDMMQQANFQEEFRVGNIEEVFKDTDGNWNAFIKIEPRFASMQMPPLVSPAIFQLNPAEPADKITDWIGMHLAGLDEKPAYGNIALFKGSCDGTKGECLRRLTAKLTGNTRTVPCLTKLGKRMNEAELALKFFKIAAQTSDDHSNVEVKPQLCKKGDTRSGCVKDSQFNFN